MRILSAAKNDRFRSIANDGKRKRSDYYYQKKKKIEIFAVVYAYNEDYLETVKKKNYKMTCKTTTIATYECDCNHRYSDM